MADEQYTQLTAWEDFIAELENAGMRAGISAEAETWNPKPKRKNKEKPPQSERLF